MNAIQAAAVLVFYPIEFGDPDQITAARLLAEIDALKEIARREKWDLCLDCHGKTYIDGTDCGCGDGECYLCERGWLEKCSLCNELGVLDADMEPPYHASEAGAAVVAGVRDWMKALVTGSCKACQRTHLRENWPCWCQCHRADKGATPCAS